MLGRTDSRRRSLVVLLAFVVAASSLVVRLAYWQVARSAEFRDFLAAQGYEPLALTGDQFSARIRTELVKWSNVVKERNIKIEQ